MQRQIPPHRPQNVPPSWAQYPDKAYPIPSEEELTRSAWMDDEFYNKSRLNIDTTALISASMHAFSSDLTPTITFAGSGSYNQVFRLQFPEPSGFSIAARIPKQTAREDGRIESTVATMSLARFVRHIPVPEVYAWHPDTNNPVGAPYMLLEWVEGIEPQERWYDLPLKARVEMLNEFARHHANFAKPLPFKGMGSVYFATDLEVDAIANSDNGVGIDLANISAYRLGPLSRGPTCTDHRGISTWPTTTPTTLRSFWLGLWQHEVDFITHAHGTDRSTIIATDKHPSSCFTENCTLGEFLDVASSLHTLITHCPLPSQEDLYAPCLAPTDYAFRNFKLDPTTLRVTAFIDWDDTYTMPFLLCSRFLEEICWYDGAWEQWYATGSFTFLPVDEEGEIEEEDEEKAGEKVEEAGGDEKELEAKDDVGGGEEVHEDEDEDEAEDEGEPEDETTGSLSSSSASPLRSPSPIPEHNHEDYDRPRRIKDTRLRAEYARLLATYDSRFAVDGFWEARTEPLKIQHLVTHGWIDWMTRGEWLRETATHSR
jgi:hypothetical protein